ncbi:hypothetical protein PTT_15102 [Pyrenophora teres f. teres 0-1]|uniref:Uncharacterized protein n=2 Tax=Pyrenophora teres f. teres TaxID=97479 RepID=E3RZL1_PYRTT|nr:hypothetical protein PTT_15102 [Pyrenophora teres f. teres 0-1]KAE8828123.1 hypothetical protein HRS9139_07342 [Pyrenophora teres f. teres]KAE8829456.1 hypothetical protein HRS9122_09271 [Pyrenophora teres f. teres]KAE8857279.1 hypothetical protein PTNB29_08346 [Pyrenophora teres f. teres]CAA9963078.1 TolA Membrane protein [Pyrenophora teres f. maculata]
MSRYRSVRRAQEQHTQQVGDFDQQQSSPTSPPVPDMPSVPHMPAASETPSQIDAPLSRSMSRYHRRPPTSHATSAVPPPIRSMTIPNAPPSPPDQLSPPVVPRNRAASSPYQQPAHTANTGQPRPRTARPCAEPSPPVSSSEPLSGDDRARDILQKEKERQRQLKDKYDAEARAKRRAKQAELDKIEKLRQEEEDAAREKEQREIEEAEALRRQNEELKAEQERGKRLQKAEPQKLVRQREEGIRKAKQEERSFKSHSSSPPASPPRQQEIGFGMFKRRKDPALGIDAPARPLGPPQMALSRSSQEEETIRPGGGGVVKGIDAPTSAVNAGDRRVTVVCNKKRILLPVTPTTTPLDLIKSAATVLSESIDIRTAVISELFTKVSITRPLRNYEYVRDVMNSWDHDSQNELTIIDSDMDGINQDDLLSYKVPDTRPEGASCFIHYSSRPGKWSKRLLILRPDGQLVMAKNEKVKEKDQENICTLTDYDIYSVTQQKLARVKPPKKICYAVKSMQKSNIFADESQYVHFFCTNDRSTANTFYSALQTWRSWYLKHQKGEGLKKKTVAQRNISGNAEGGQLSSHARGESVGSHYQLGAFSSLLDMESLNKQLDQIEVHKPGEFPDDKPLSKLDSRGVQTRMRSIRVKQNALTRHGVGKESVRKTSARRSFEEGGDEAFASTGLLGRTYTERQAAAQAREQQQSGPFTEGPSLLNNMGRGALAAPVDTSIKRSTSVTSNHHRRTSSDLRRSASKRAPGMPEPLIDLTPQYRPPPQHLNKGKGYNPGAGAGPLVESATSIEEAIKVPPSTDWRAGRPGTRGGHGTYGGAGHERTRSLKGRGEPLAAYTQNNHSGAPEDVSKAFTGGGLLSQAGYSQGRDVVGRGVMDGSKAKGPMVNLALNSEFVQGSLLAGVPDAAPIIDRSGK